MKKMFETAVLSLMILCMYAYSVQPVEAKTEDSYVSLEELIENAEEYDGKTVTYQGEAIGDPLNRTDHTWVNISDGNNSAIGVYMTASDASKISMYGAYEIKGDVLIVTGVFHEACSEHGGDLDIHAQNVEIKENGYRMTESWSEKMLCAALLSAAAAGVLLAFALYRIRCYNSQKSGKDA